MSFKKIILFLHRWLGLISGLVVFIVSITGCLFTFQKEISESVWKEKYFVQPQKQTLPLSLLLQHAQHALRENQPIENIEVYKDERRAWEFMAYKTNDTAITYFGTVEYFRSAFVNPYTGEITGIRDYKYDFFNLVKYIHWSLLLNTKYGQPIVGYSTLIFVILLITGIILWFPKKWNKTTKQQALSIKWKARLKRLNYDLHNVLGFYSLIIALVLVLTGMVFSFQWFSSIVYAAASGKTSFPTQKKVVSVGLENKNEENALDKAYQSANSLLQTAKRIGISPAKGKEGTIHFYGYHGKETYYGSDELQYDQHSGKLLSRRNDSEKNRGEKLIEMNYDIHVGAIGGIAGKIIAFIASLICASLPVTGFYIWWGKRKKKSSKKTGRNTIVLNNENKNYSTKSMANRGDFQTLK